MRLSAPCRLHKFLPQHIPFILLRLRCSYFSLSVQAFDILPFITLIRNQADLHYLCSSQLLQVCIASPFDERILSGTCYLISSWRVQGTYFVSFPEQPQHPLEPELWEDQPLRIESFMPPYLYHLFLFSPSFGQRTQRLVFSWFITFIAHPFPTTCTDVLARVFEVVIRDRHTNQHLPHHYLLADKPSGIPQHITCNALPSSIRGECQRLYTLAGGLAFRIWPPVIGSPSPLYMLSSSIESKDGE